MWSVFSHSSESCEWIVHRRIYQFLFFFLSAAFGWSTGSRMPGFEDAAAAGTGAIECISEQNQDAGWGSTWSRTSRAGTEGLPSQGTLRTKGIDNRSKRVLLELVFIKRTIYVCVCTQAWRWGRVFLFFSNIYVCYIVCVRMHIYVWGQAFVPWVVWKSECHVSLFIFYLVCGSWPTLLSILP